MAEYFQEQFTADKNQLLVITGPCHAEEVALEKLSYLTIAGTDCDRCACIASIIKGRYIKTVQSEDVFGTEYAAVLKNIYAIASGKCLRSAAMQLHRFPGQHQPGWQQQRQQGHFPYYAGRNCLC